MINRYIHTTVLIAVFCAVAIAGDIHKEIKRTKEKEVRVKLSASFGTVHINKGSPNKIVVVDFKMHKDNDSDLDIDYRLHNDAGNLSISLNPERHRSDRNIRFDDEKDGDTPEDMRNDTWYVRLTPEIPLDIDAELGAGRSDFDLGDMNIKQFSISTGATSTKMLFSKPNRGTMEQMKIETGVSKFSGEQLNNANFKELEFEGGVGSYYLDFSGALTREVDVRISIGLGALTIVIPKEIGAKIKYNDSWLSKISFDDEFIFERKGLYKTPNYSSSSGKMNISIESGLGSVKVRRSD